jgi:hypothetical protein
MHRILLVGLLVLAGCQGVVGPFQRRAAPSDNRSLTIDEQERSSRDRLALPQGGAEIGPRTGAEQPFVPNITRGQ